MSWNAAPPLVNGVSAFARSRSGQRTASSSPMTTPQRPDSGEPSSTGVPNDASDVARGQETGA